MSWSAPLVSSTVRESTTDCVRNAIRVGIFALMTPVTIFTDGRESEWSPGVADGQGGLACCDSWGRKESDMTEQLNWLNWVYTVIWFFYSLSKHSPTLKAPNGCVIAHIATGERHLSFRWWLFLGLFSLSLIWSKGKLTDKGFLSSAPVWKSVH